MITQFMIAVLPLMTSTADKHYLPYQGCPTALLHMCIPSHMLGHSHALCSNAGVQIEVMAVLIVWVVKESCITFDARAVPLHPAQGARPEYSSPLGAACQAVVCWPILGASAETIWPGRA